MKSPAAICLLALGLLSLLPRPAAIAQEASQATVTPASLDTPSVERIVKHIARGVDLIQEITPATAPGGPLIVTVIEVDPHVPGVRVESALGQDRVWNRDATLGREVVSTLTARHKAVAGINAGFFPFAGDPYGMHIENGNLVTEPLAKAPRTVFYITKSNTSGFATFGFKGTARIVDVSSAADAQSANSLTHAIDGLNRKPGGAGDASGELLLFTPIWSPKTLPTKGRVEVILRGVRMPLRPNHEYVCPVAAVTMDGETDIAPGTVVLSGIGPGADFLNAATSHTGAKIAFRLEVASLSGTDEPRAETIAQSVSGGPRLLTNSVVTNQYQQEGFARDFSTTHHPRSAIGRKADGKLLLVTVDGRQKTLSGGAALLDLAAILHRFGATDAVNLDGGGSSTAVVWDAVANSPSEGVERPIADALLVYAEPLPPASVAKETALTVPDHPLEVGETWDFAGDSPLLRGARAVWGESGGKGFVGQDGVFHALRPGVGSVRVTIGSREHVFTTSVIVVGKSQSDAAGFAAKLTLAPPAADTPLQQTLTIHVANAEGDPLADEPVALTIGGGTAKPDAVVTNPHGDAKVTITWDAPLSATAPRSILVTSPRKRFNNATLAPQ